MSLPKELADRIKQAEAVLYELQKQHGFIEKDRDFKIKGISFGWYSCGGIRVQIGGWSGGGLDACDISDATRAIPHLNAYVDWQVEQIKKRKAEIDATISAFDQSFRYMIVTESNRDEIITRLTPTPQVIRLPDTPVETYTMRKRRWFDNDFTVFLFCMALMTVVFGAWEWAHPTLSESKPAQTTTQPAMTPEQTEAAIKQIRDEIRSKSQPTPVPQSERAKEK